MVATRLADGKVQVVADRVGGLDKTERVAPEVIDVGAVLDAVAGAQAHGRVAIIG